MDQRNRVVGIKEKVAISRLANSGAYVFCDGHELRRGAASFLDLSVGDLALGEYYTSALISHMIDGGATFTVLSIPTDVRHHFAPRP